MRHAEIFFDPQTHTARGVPIADVIDGLARACVDAQAELGASSRLILCFLRHLSEDAAMATLEQALPLREHFIGVGLDCSERGHPPEKFARVFARCRALGLHRVAHAGEEGRRPTSSRRWTCCRSSASTTACAASRTPALVQRLAATRMPLTVCPLSNVKLCVFRRWREHNLPALLAAGLCATVNCDDPAYFGGYVNQNYIRDLRRAARAGRARSLHAGAQRLRGQLRPCSTSALDGSAERELCAVRQDRLRQVRLPDLPNKNKLCWVTRTV